MNNDDNIMICLPTGCGKNMVIIKSFEEDRKYLVLVPRIVLMEQLFQEIIRMTHFSKDDIQLIGDGNNSFDTKKLITICIFNSIDVVYPHIKDFYRIYIDEAHHIYKPDLYLTVQSETYSKKIHEFHELKNVVALSATIDAHHSFQYYKKDIRDMIDEGYLCDYTIHIPVFSDDPSNLNIANYLVNKYRYVIIYCNTKREGIEFNEKLNQIQNGISQYIDSDTRKKTRREVLESWRKGEFYFLVNVELLIEGFDAPITRGVCFIHMPSSKTKIIQVIGRTLRKHPLKTLANVILPFSKSGDEDSIKDFLRIISTNDKNIRNSYETKTLGGYINIYYEEDNKEAEYRGELIYDSLGSVIRTCLNTEIKIRALIQFVKENERVPKYKDNLYKYFDNPTKQEVEIKLFDFYMSCIRGRIESFINILDDNPIIKLDYEEYLKRKETKLLPAKKIEILEEFIRENNRLPTSRETVTTVYNTDFIIGKFYGELKQGYNKQLYEDLMKRNKMVKDDYDLYIENKSKRIDQETRIEYLKTFIGFKERVPKSKEKYTFDGIECNIGSFYDGLKHQNSDEYKELVEEYEIVRKDYEKLVQFRKVKTPFTVEETITILEKFIKDNNRVPKANETIIYNSHKVKIGIFYQNSKRRGTNESFLNFIKNNEIAKKDYEIFLNK